MGSVHGHSSHLTGSSCCMHASGQVPVLIKRSQNTKLSVQISYCFYSQLIGMECLHQNHRTKQHMLQSMEKPGNMLVITKIWCIYVCGTNHRCVHHRNSILPLNSLLGQCCETILHSSESKTVNRNHCSNFAFLPVSLSSEQARDTSRTG